MPEVNLKELSDRATPGPWSVESMDNEGNSPSDKFTSYCIEANGKSLADTLNSLTICLEDEQDEDWSRTWDEQGRRDTVFIAALVNAYRAGRLHDADALASDVALARREALEEVGAATANDEWAVADTTGLRHLRMRLEGALAARREERDTESVAWLSAGVQALDEALIYAAERDRERRGRLIAEARYEPWRQESRRLERELRAIRALADSPPETRQTVAGWRPISEAPKDGTIVDLYNGYRHTGLYWDDEQRPGGGWSDVRDKDRHRRDRHGVYGATHFMLAPNPPAPAIANLDGEGRS